MTADGDLAALLGYIKETRGFDFTGYKRSSLERRIAKRLEVVKVGSYADYQDYLEVHADEFAFLFNTILINVTRFFRDPETWDYLAGQVIPELLDRMGPDRPVRVWCAGCASGEETYTMAMLLAEALGESEYVRRVKIYATDVDEEALREARAASFPAKAMDDVPEALRGRYFEQVEQRFVFRKELRRTIIFGRNDLVQDAPISRVDLLGCRNTLMYFNAETQARILEHFHFALNDWGYLHLGRAEMLLVRGSPFRPVATNERVFRKVPAAQNGRQQRPLVLGLESLLDDAQADAPPRPPVELQALETAPVAQLVIGAQLQLVSVNRAARELLGVNGADLDRPLKDLELSYRPAELRGPVQTAMRERRPVDVGVVRYGGAGREPVHLAVRVTPLTEAEVVLGTSITFDDVTEQRRMQAELEETSRNLESAYEELQSTVEELETTNEELQSTNEELETTNEELQSANEELETMNEELQSTNEELQTMNDELRHRSRQLDDVNDFLETVLTSIGLAVTVLDRELRITAWNEHSTELWGMRAEEAIGQHLLNLDIGLPLAELQPLVRETLADPEARLERVVDAVNRRGRAIRCTVTVLPLRGSNNGTVAGAVLLTEQKHD